jgi:hypothetical protein
MIRHLRTKALQLCPINYSTITVLLTRRQYGKVYAAVTGVLLTVCGSGGTCSTHVGRRNWYKILVGRGQYRNIDLVGGGILLKMGHIRPICVKWVTHLLLSIYSRLHVSAVIASHNKALKRWYRKNLCCINVYKWLVIRAETCSRE